MANTVPGICPRDRREQSDLISGKDVLCSWDPTKHLDDKHLDARILPRPLTIHQLPIATVLLHLSTRWSIPLQVPDSEKPYARYTWKYPTSINALGDFPTPNLQHEKNLIDIISLARDKKSEEIGALQSVLCLAKMDGLDRT